MCLVISFFFVSITFRIANVKNPFASSFVMSLTMILVWFFILLVSIVLNIETDFIRWSVGPIVPPAYDILLLDSQAVGSVIYLSLISVPLLYLAVHLLMNFFAEDLDPKLRKDFVRNYVIVTHPFFFPFGFYFGIKYLMQLRHKHS